jgi:hypothetical protein
VTWNWYDDGTRVCHTHFLKYHDLEGCPNCLSDLREMMTLALEQAKRTKEAVEAEIKEREAMWELAP